MDELNARQVQTKTQLDLVRAEIRQAQHRLIELQRHEAELEAQYESLLVQLLPLEKPAPAPTAPNHAAVRATPAPRTPLTPARSPSDVTTDSAVLVQPDLSREQMQSNVQQSYKHFGLSVPAFASESTPVTLCMRSSVAEKELTPDVLAAIDNEAGQLTRDAFASDKLAVCPGLELQADACSWESAVQTLASKADCDHNYTTLLLYSTFMVTRQCDVTAFERISQSRMFQQHLLDICSCIHWVVDRLDDRCKKFSTHVAVVLFSRGQKPLRRLFKATTRPAAVELLLRHINGAADILDEKLSKFKHSATCEKSLSTTLHALLRRLSSAADVSAALSGLAGRAPTRSVRIQHADDTTLLDKSSASSAPHHSSMMAGEHASREDAFDEAVASWCSEARDEELNVEHTLLKRETLLKLQSDQRLCDEILNTYPLLSVEATAPKPSFITSWLYKSISEYNSERSTSLAGITKFMAKQSSHVFVVVVHEADHWMAAEFNVKRKTLRFYDPLMGRSTTGALKILRWLQATQEFPADMSIQHEAYHSQTDSVSCGVYTSIVLRHWMQGAPLPTKSDSVELRKHMFESYRGEFQKLTSLQSHQTPVLKQAEVTEPQAHRAVTDVRIFTGPPSDDHESMSVDSSESLEKRDTHFEDALFNMDVDS